MQLRYLNVAHLVAEAGGDPWAISRTLQSGRPAQISYLAKAFHDAGQQTGEAEAAFASARRRFEEAWNRENGEHPINDAAEVQRASNTLGVQAAQLPKIAADLEQVAAILAEAQRATAGRIRLLESTLERLDRELVESHYLEHSGDLSMLEAMALDDVIGDLERQAVDETTGALHQVEHVRVTYSDLLHGLTKHMRTPGGYDAAPVDGLDGHQSETPGSAEKDVHAALAGDQEAAARVNSVLDSITAEQLAGKVPLSSEQALVLSQLQAQEHGISIEALQGAQDRLGAQRQMIANSWQLMSNGAVSFPRTELKPGALPGSEVVRGAVGQLPDSVQQALEGPWTLTMGGMATIANIVRDGSPAFQTNTELDRAMIRQASRTLAGSDWQRIAATAGLIGPDGPFDLKVARILAAVSPDHQVIHDMLLGPDRDTFLHDISHHFWSDNGKVVASLFDWTEASAHGPESGIAGRTAHAYAEYVSKNAEALLKLPGNHTLGEMNPGLTLGMAHGLTPYIGNIAGTGGALADFTGPTQAGATDFANGSLPAAKGIFSVLSSGDEASKYFNGAADARAIVAEANYAQALAHHAPLASHDANLHDAMTLRGLVNSGLHTAAQASVENNHTTQQQAQLDEYTSRKTAYEVGAKTLSSVISFLPGAGPYVGAGVSAYGTAIENDVVGAAPTSIPLTDHPVPNMPISQADREILNAVIAAGQHVPIAPEYLIDGRIASPDELSRTSMGFNAGQYDQILGQAMADLYTQTYGNVSGRLSIPDQLMIDRYDAVVLDSRR